MIKLKDLIVENKSDKKTFDKIVKALKDIKVRATIHLNDKDKITITKTKERSTLALPLIEDLHLTTFIYPSSNPSSAPVELNIYDLDNGNFYFEVLQSIMYSLLNPENFLPRYSIPPDGNLFTPGYLLLMLSSF